MTAVAVPTRSNGQRYNFLGTTALINAYAEQIGTDGKGPYAAVPCDGAVSFKEVADTPMRGFIYLEDLDCIYAVFSSSAYKITYDGTTATATRVGNIPGTDVVQIVRNQKSTPQVGILCAAGIYVIESDAVSKIDDDDLPTAVSIAQQGGYTIFGIEDGRFFISSINEMKEIDGTDYATAEQSPDKLIRVWADRGELFIMSQRTIEVWRNTGNADFPFEPLINRAIPRGIMAANSVASFDNTLGWVGENAIVYRMNGYTPTRISTYEIEAKIRDSDNQTGIIGFSWSRSGHEFYTITDGSWTYTYDAATNLWHQRKSYQEDVWQMRFAVFAWSMVLVGSIHNGTIYYLDNNTYTEAGSPMIWTVRFPPMHVFPNGGIADALHFDMATGFGLVDTAAQGYDPDVMLRVYKDGGNSIAIERHIKLGKRGKSKTRISPRRLGKFGPQGLVSELAISDPVARSVVLADAKVRPLRLQ